MLHSTASLIRNACTIHHHLKVMPRICGPSQKGGWTQPHDIPPLIQHKLPQYLNLSREEDELHSPQTDSMTKQLRKKPLAKTDTNHEW
jgi:hypothetical protein